MPGGLRGGRARRGGRSALRGRARPGPAPAAAVSRRGRGEGGALPARPIVASAARDVTRPGNRRRSRNGEAGGGRARAAPGASSVRADAPPRPSPAPPGAAGAPGTGTGARTGALEGTGTGTGTLLGCGDTGSAPVPRGCRRGRGAPVSAVPARRPRAKSCFDFLYSLTP